MTMHRRGLLAAGAAAGLVSAARAAAPALKVTLLGQALILHDLRPQPWPDRAAFTRRLKAADVVFTDLEVALEVPGIGAATRGPLILHNAPVEVLDSLTDLGVTMVATANNHAWDFDSAGVTAAIAPITAHGLTYAGTGADLAAAAAPGYQKTPHGTVALVACATGALKPEAAATATRAGVNVLRHDPVTGLNTEDVARIMASVTAAAAKADLVMLYHHNHDWEKDSGQTPGWQKILARQAIDAGAGMFVSHGAPVLQGIELYRGRPIFYDLGDFTFQSRTTDDRYGAGALLGVIVEGAFDKGRFRRAELTPIVLSPTGPGDTAGRPMLAPADQGAAILARLRALSEPGGVTLTVADGRGVFTGG